MFNLAIKVHGLGEEAFVSFQFRRDTNSFLIKWAVLVETLAFGLWLEQRNLLRI